MEVHTRQVGETLISQYPVFDEDGFTYLSGIPSGDFEISQFLDGTEAVVTATVSEIGTSGIYQVEFTPTASGQWAIFVNLPDTGDVWGTHVTVYENVSRDIAEAMMNVAYDEDSSELYLEVWLDRSGRTVEATELISCIVSVYSASGVLQFTEASSTPKVTGHFSIQRTAVFNENQPYNAMVTVVDLRGSVTTSQAFTTVG